MVYRPEGRSEALAAKGNGIDVDISGSIVDSVAESRSATCARCNARGAVDGAQEMARHASGTISQWWFRFLEQDRGTRGAEARKEVIWLAASGAPASSKQAGKKNISLASPQRAHSPRRTYLQVNFWSLPLAELSRSGPKLVGKRTPRKRKEGGK